jgi:hypothetical protein
MDCDVVADGLQFPESFGQDVQSGRRHRFSEGIRRDPDAGQIGLKG